MARADALDAAAEAPAEPKTFTAHEAYVCARVLAGIERTARELGDTDPESSLAMYRLLGALQFRIYGFISYEL